MRDLHIALMGALLIAISRSSAIAQAAESSQTSADTSRLNFRQFGLLAVQDGGRRKPIDTFARETLIRITGRSTYTAKLIENGSRAISFCRLGWKRTIGGMSQWCSFR